MKKTLKTLALCAILSLCWSGKAFAQDVTESLVKQLAESKSPGHVFLTQKLSNKENPYKVQLLSYDLPTDRKDLLHLLETDTELMIKKNIIPLPKNYATLSSCQRQFVLEFLNISGAFVAGASDDEIKLLSKYTLQEAVYGQSNNHVVAKKAVERVEPLLNEHLPKALRVLLSCKELTDVGFGEITTNDEEVKNAWIFVSRYIGEWLDEKIKLLQDKINLQAKQ